jgi:hypothetical protein
LSQKLLWFFAHAAVVVGSLLGMGGESADESNSSANGMANMRLWGNKGMSDTCVADLMVFEIGLEV